jgi:hypothetical protein
MAGYELKMEELLPSSASFTIIITGRYKILLKKSTTPSNSPRIPLERFQILTQMTG